MFSFRKKTKKIVSILLCICLIFGMLPEKVFAASSTDMVMKFSTTSNNNFNFWGELSDGTKIKTTYGDNGYATAVKIDSTVYNSGPRNCQDWIQGDITVKTKVETVSNGRYVKITYTVINNGSVPHTIGIATHADTQIYNTDSAAINKVGNALEMTDGTYTFRILVSDASGVSDIDTYWVGPYGQRTSHCFTQEAVGSTSGVDSGITFGWINRVVPANSTLSLATSGGIGTLNKRPVLNASIPNQKAYYWPNEVVSINGTVDDPDIGDKLEVVYSLDDHLATPVVPETALPQKFTSNGSPQNFAQSITLPSNMTAGEHILKFWARDQDGETSPTVTLKFTTKKDTVNPTLTLSATPTTWTNGNVVINAVASDADSGVLKIECTTAGYTGNNSAQTDKTKYSKTVTTNGTYTFKATDMWNNSITKSITISNIDKAAPALTVSKSDVSTWINRDWIGQFSYSDSPSGIKSATYSYLSKTASLPNGTQINISDEGNYTLSIDITDNANNKTSKTYPIKIDKTKPIINSHSTEILSNPLLRSRIITNKQVKITLSSSDNLSGVKYLEYKLPGQASYTKLADGVNNFIVQESITGPISVYAYDNAGNKSNEYIINDITTEVTPPSISITSQISTWYNTDAAINVKSTDTNGISNVSYILKNSSGTTTKNGNISLDSSGNGNIIFTDEGQHILDLTSVDNAGNTSTLNGTAINIDKTKPLINSYTPTITSNPLLRSAITNKQIVVDLNITDNLSGFNYFEYKLPGQSSYTRGTEKSFTISESLKGTISIYAYDIAGNKSDEFLITDIIAETVAPSLVITSRIPEWFTTDANINIVSTDENGIKSLNYLLKDKTQTNTVDSGSLPVNSSGNSVYTYSNEGEYVLDLTLTDNAGNTKTLNGTKINIDKTPPNMGNVKIEELPSLLRSRIITNKQVKVSFPDITDNLSGFDYLKYKLPGTNEYTTLNSGVKEFIINSTINGEISVIAYDKAGNSIETKINDIITETTPPSLSVDKVSLQSWYNENSSLPSFPITVNDDNGLKSVVYTVYTTKNNGKVISDKPITIINNSGIIDISNDGQWLDDDIYKVEVIATDNAGNKTTDDSLEINIDRTKPTIDASPTPPDYVKDELTISVSSGDNLSRIKEFYYNYNGKNDLSSRDLKDYNNISISDTGIHDIVITAIDNAGNKSTTTRTFKIDNENPVVDNYSFIEAPATFSMTTSSPIRVMVQAHDNHSLVDYLEYSEDNNIFKRMEEQNISGNNYYGYFDVDKEWIGNIYVRAVDKVGNVSDIFTIGDLIIDRTPPVLTVDEISGWYNEDININVSASDGIEMNALYYQIDNGEHINITSNSITMSDEGDYELKITATDTSNNVSYAIRHIQLDKTKPVINSHIFEEHEAPMMLSSDITYSNKIVSVSLDMADELSLISKFEFKLPISDQWQNGTIVQKDNLYKFTVGDEINGPILVRVYDNAENVSDTYEINDLVIDKTPPEITISNPPTSDFWINSYTDSNLDINVSSNDSLDKVAKTSWFMYKNDAENPIISGNLDENLISLTPDDFSEGDGIYTIIVNA